MTCTASMRICWRWRVAAIAAFAAAKHATLGTFRVTRCGGSQVPQPVRAVLLLFPITAASEAAKAAQEARLAEGQEARDAPICRLLRRIAKPAACMLAPRHDAGLMRAPAAAQVSPRVWFTRQTVGNACGTVGLLHALANNAAEIVPTPGGFLAGFLARTAGMDASARAKALEDDETLDSAHAAAASGGQTAAPDADDEVNLHFIVFVHVDGGLYELDGRKPGPVRHGATTAGTLLADACAVVQREFVASAVGDVHFNVIALAPAAGND